MRLPNSEHTSRPWRIHEITDDFRLEDVWALPVHGDRSDFLALVQGLAAGDPSQGSWLARTLWSIRWKLGGLLGWDEAETGLGERVPTLRRRLPEDLLDAPGPHFAKLPFTSLYLIEGEFAAEIANRTMHGVMHLSWVADETGAYRGQMAVLVKPNGLLGVMYMAAIRPFRHLIVYPAMMRQIEREWAAGIQNRPITDPPEPFDRGHAPSARRSAAAAAPGDCDAFGGDDSAAVDIHHVVPDWTIRHASEHDIERVLSLWDSAGSADNETVTDTRDGVLGLLDADPDALLVVESDDGEIEGSLIAAWDGWRGSFYRLAVHSDQRRAGIATALLREGERRLQARGAARFTAIVTDDDPEAMGFWTATGYEQQESRARFVRNVVVPRTQAPARDGEPVQ